MTREKAIATCINEINKHQCALFSASNSQKYEIMKDLYGTVKQLSPEFVKTNADVDKFRSMALQIALMAQHLLPSESIINVKPYDFSKNRILLPGMDADAILDFLVYKVRTMLREDSDIDRKSVV